MEGSLFTSGFLGANFQWWIGQIGDDSEHRDNILPGKHESVETIPGWGKRYKVRIIGLHDQTEEVIPSSQKAGHNDLATMGLVAGFIVMMVLDVALGG